MNHTRQASEAANALIHMLLTDDIPSDTQLLVQEYFPHVNTCMTLVENVDRILETTAEERSAAKRCAVCWETGGALATEAKSPLNPGVFTVHHACGVVHIARMLAMWCFHKDGARGVQQHRVPMKSIITPPEGVFDKIIERTDQNLGTRGLIRGVDIQRRDDDEGYDIVIDIDMDEVNAFHDRARGI